jgi:hypothetical protein
MLIPYNIMTKTARVDEDVNLIMFWRRNEGGTGKNFSRRDATLHYLTAAVTHGIPPLPF